MNAEATLRWTTGQAAPDVSILNDVARKWLSDVRWFSRLVVRRPLRAYQSEPAVAIVDSVLHKRGLEFAILFPRQSGKNEMQGHLEGYLLNLFQRIKGAQIVHASPTFKPQSQNAMRRLEQVLRNDWNKGQVVKRDGYIVGLGEAIVTFFSTEHSANVVGATASVLLICDEAQHVQENIWLERFVPMAASVNATIAYFGTAWTSRTLLARTIEQLHVMEALDGIRRVFVVTPDQVAQDNPPYGDFVKRQVAKLGRTHPLVKTQYFNETIDAEGGMFPPARRALMQGAHPRVRQPTPGKIYAMLLDVAGEDEGAPPDGAELATLLANPRRDSTALTIVEVDTSTLADPLIKAPTYKCVDRKTWIGTKHVALYAQIRALVDHWGARYLVVDATGVGAGVASFLLSALGEQRVIPFTFTSPSKSQLGWDFLAICDTGRWKEYGQTDMSAPSAQFWQQLEFCQYEVRPGPSQLVKWGVPDGTRDPVTGEIVHDDLLTSAALSAVLDTLAWPSGPSLIVRRADPLKDYDRESF